MGGEQEGAKVDANRRSPGPKIVVNNAKRPKELLDGVGCATHLQLETPCISWFTSQ